LPSLCFSLSLSLPTSGRSLSPSSLPADLCQLPSEHGPCDLKVTRWFYDLKTQRCKKFTYGGCAGNANNFKRRLGCRLRCRKRGECQGGMQIFLLPVLWAWACFPWG
uniref:BPTI/Kunitz inhibitor domain-containing protein n=1 Tax=Laticauda laticaudata TaxID=8630 RepID=A0A8C5SNZ9_LATLA